MRSRKKRQLTGAEKRALISAGLIVTRYAPDGERATVWQLAPEGEERRRDFVRRLTDETPIGPGPLGGTRPRQRGERA